MGKSATSFARVAFPRTTSVPSLVAAAYQSTTLRFLATGGGGAVLFFTLSLLAARVGLSPFSGTLCAYATAFVVVYTTQRTWTFRGRHRHRDALPRYLATQLGCALFSAALAHWLATAGHLPPVATAATTTVLSSAASYTLSRYWVFGRRLRAGHAPG